MDVFKLEDNKDKMYCLLDVYSWDGLPMHLPTSDDLHLAVHSFMYFLLLFQLQETKIMFSLVILKALS